MKKIRFCKNCHQEVKNFYAKLCGSCYRKTLKGEKHPNWKGSSICIECGDKRNRHNKTKLCGECYKKEFLKGLPKCKRCGKLLSNYGGLKIGTGYCQKCYVGKRTKRWNPNLTNKFRLGGRSINPNYIKWRKRVFKRDAYTCQKCGDSRGGNLIAHHIENFAKNPLLRTQVRNGITFCRNCHSDFHHVYSYFDNNKEQLEEFLKWKYNNVTRITVGN